MKKKITFLMLHLNYGGIEKQVTTLANQLASSYRIEIISLYDILGKSFYPLDPRIKVKYILPYGPNKKEIINAFQSFHFLAFYREIKKACKLLYVKYFQVKKVIQELQTDILVSSRIEFSKKIRRKDIITISQEHSYICTNSYKRKVKNSFQYIDYLIVMTKTAKNQYDEWLKECRQRPRIVLIPNMIEDYIGEGTNLHNKQIISVGRLDKIKDFPSLISVFDRVRENHPDWILKIVGEGKERKKIEKKIAELGLQKNVILTGQMTSDEISKELEQSAIFVLTSKSESFSLVLVEAMAHHVPCVSYAIEVGPKEIITDREDGFLIADRSELEMANKINFLIEDSAKRVEIGNRASLVAQKYYATNVVKRWKELFEK